MPTSVPEGSWHSGGYYGHDRSKAHNERAQTYRRLACPQPPNVFLSRLQLPRSSHSFSEHDSRRALSCGPLYFEHNIGKRRSSMLQPRGRRSRDLLTWIPDSERVLGKQEEPLSTYTVDYRGVMIPQSNQRLVQHLRDSVEDEKLMPISTYRYVHCSLYPELHDESVNQEPLQVVKRSTDLIDIRKPPTPTWKEIPQNASVYRPALCRSRPRNGTMPESVARCLVWYQPSALVKTAGTQTVGCENGKSQNSEHPITRCSAENNESSTTAVINSSSDQNIPPRVIAL